MFVLDLFVARKQRDFDVWLSALAALLASAKFVQMKYPSADSLNQVAGGNYSYEQIVGMETSLLVEIDWELL